MLFFEKYSELKNTPFYLTGESYAGKYLPLYTHDIITNFATNNLTNL